MGENRKGISIVLNYIDLKFGEVEDSRYLEEGYTEVIVGWPIDTLMHRILVVQQALLHRFDCFTAAASFVLIFYVLSLIFLPLLQMFKFL